jgi:hypothetical protein
MSATRVNQLLMPYCSEVSIDCADGDVRIPVSRTEMSV